MKLAFDGRATAYMNKTEMNDSWSRLVLWLSVQSVRGLQRKRRRGTCLAADSRAARPLQQRRQPTALLPHDPPSSPCSLDRSTSSTGRARQTDSSNRRRRLRHAAAARRRDGQTAEPRTSDWYRACWRHRRQLAAYRRHGSPIFTARRYASAVYAVVVCQSVSLSVCHKPVLYQSA